MNYMEPINVLNPIIPREKIEKIAGFCADHMLDWRHLLDIGTSRLLRTFLSEDDIEDQVQYSRCLDFADKSWEYLVSKTDSDGLRFRSIAYILKPANETMYRVGYSFPCDLRPGLTLNYFSPATESAKVDAMADFCLKNLITAVDILDAALCWYGVEEATADYSHIKGAGLLDLDRITTGAQAGKMLSGYLGYLGAKPYEKIVTLLMLAKAGSVNMLGICAKNLNTQSGCEGA